MHANGLRPGVILFGFCAAAFAAVAWGLPPAPPAAPVRPVVDDYYGTQVTDNYRWMEAAENPELDAWMKAQSDYTRAVLDATPGRDAMLQEIAQADGANTSVFWLMPAGGKFFYMKLQPGEAIPTLDVRDGLDGAERVLVDPRTLQQGDTHFSINYIRPSYDGRYVAYGLSPGGSEKSVLHVVEVQSGKLLDEAIDRVEGDGGFVPVAWRPDSRGFFYYREQALGPKDPPSAKFLKSRDYLHLLGKNSAGDGDKPVFGFGVDRSIAVAPDEDALISTSADSPYAFGLLTKNEETDLIPGLYVARIADLGIKADPWRRISGEADDVTGFAAHGDAVYLLTHQDAPHFKVLLTSLQHPDFRKAKVVVAQGDAVIEKLIAGRDGLYVRLLDNGLGKAERVSYKDGKAQPVPLPFEGTIADMVVAPDADGAYFQLTSWTRSPLWFAYDPAKGALTDTKLQPPSPVDFSGVETREVEAVSYDGTRVPLSIIMPKGIALDGSHPVLLTGYGSYAINLDPGFLPAYLPWLKRGGIFAVAHVRGGGEKGEDWHEGGMKLTKINTVLDFIACAQYLVDQHYTSPAHLSGMGTSAGGVTIGGAITWRPDLFAAAIDNVGMTDTLRVETTPNGPPNVVEFGSVTTPEGFHGLYAMSAYAHVRDGVAYPAVLLMTGAHDPRVAPWIVAKMAARLQAASSSGKPVLLRVDYDAGHGIGSTRTQRDAQLADVFTFLLGQLQPAAAGQP